MLLYFHFNKTIIPLVLVGYEMIIANLVLHASSGNVLSIILYPTCASRIIVN